MESQKTLMLPSKFSLGTHPIAPFCSLLVLLVGASTGAAIMTVGCLYICNANGWWCANGNPSQPEARGPVTLQCLGFWLLAMVNVVLTVSDVQTSITSLIAPTTAKDAKDEDANIIAEQTPSDSMVTNTTLDHEWGHEEHSKPTTATHKKYYSKFWTKQDVMKRNVHDSDSFLANKSSAPALELECADSSVFSKCNHGPHRDAHFISGLEPVPNGEWEHYGRADIPEKCSRTPIQFLEKFVSDLSQDTSSPDNKRPGHAQLYRRVSFQNDDASPKLPSRTKSFESKALVMVDSPPRPPKRAVPSDDEKSNEDESWSPSRATTNHDGGKNGANRWLMSQGPNPHDGAPGMPVRLVSRVSNIDTDAPQDQTLQ